MFFKLLSILWLISIIDEKKMLLFWIFATFLKLYKWIGCTGDVYPIVHGNYLCEFPLPNVPSDFIYKHTRNPTVLDVNTYLNGDILVSYYFQIVIGTQNANLTLGQTSGIAKLDYLTGKTLWAKEIYANNNNNLFMVVNSYIVDDYSWTMLVANNSASNYPGIVLKLDTDGIIQDSFSVINSYKSGNYSYLLYVYKFYMASDNSMLIFAESSYLPNEIGVSNASSIDLSIFKIDSNKDFVWSTSVDFMHGVDEFPASGYIYKETVYASISSARNYLWIFTLDYLEGHLQNSRCLYLYK